MHSFHRPSRAGEVVAIRAHAQLRVLQRRSGMDLGTGRDRSGMTAPRDTLSQAVQCRLDEGVRYASLRTVPASHHARLTHSLTPFFAARHPSSLASVRRVHSSASGTPGQTGALLPPSSALLGKADMLGGFWNTARRCIASANRNGAVSRGAPDTSPGRVRELFQTQSRMRGCQYAYSASSSRLIAMRRCIRRPICTASRCVSCVAFLYITAISRL